MRRFSVQPQDIDGTAAVIYGSEANHIQNVLRLSPGCVIRLFDGTGLEYNASIDLISPDKISVTILDTIRPQTESPIHLSVALGFLKDKKMDHLIPPLTELGMAQFIPFLAERSISRPDADRLKNRMKRWEKIAAESLKQCRRSQPPQIGPALTFAEVLTLGGNSDTRLLFWENSRTPVDLSGNSRTISANKIMMVLGPEGGFSDREIEQAENAGFSIVSLGPRILKAENAPIAACAITQYLFGDMGNKYLDKASGIH